MWSPQVSAGDNLGGRRPAAAGTCASAGRLPEGAAAGRHAQPRRGAFRPRTPAPTWPVAISRLTKPRHKQAMSVDIPRCQGPCRSWISRRYRLTGRRGTSIRSDLLRVKLRFHSLWTQRYNSSKASFDRDTWTSAASGTAGSQKWQKTGLFRSAEAAQLAGTTVN